MIQIIGLIMAVYCVARLIQVPLETGAANPKTGTITVVSVLAVVLIGLLTLMLLTTGGPQ